MVLFQDSSTQSENFDDVEVADLTRRRSVGERAHLTSQILQCPNLHGKNQGPDHLKAEISIEWFFRSSRDHDVSRQIDITWVFLRLRPKKLFDINFERTGNQKMPGWTVFHAMISHRVYRSTNVGYCKQLLHPQQTLTLFTLF